MSDAHDEVRPDPAWYASIGGDATVQRALALFYDRVFADPIIGHHFRTSDKEMLKAKQFGFMKRCFTGERDAYIGQRPRNAHHAMVISDAEFDHREALMRDALRDVGLAQVQIDRWIAVEELFRRQIVKSAPQPLYYRGFETYWAHEPKPERLECASVCDVCGGEVEAGDTVWVTGATAACRGCHERAA